MSKVFNARKKTSPVWNYFIPIDKQYGRCNECQKLVSYKTSISNLRKHLSSKHPYLSVVTQDFIHKYSQKNSKEFDQEGEECDIEEETEVTETEEAVMHITPNKLMMPKNTLSNQILMKTPSSLPPQKRIKPSHPNNKSQVIQEAINMLSSVSHAEPTPENDDDEFSQFGKYLISQLRQLPLISALQLQDKFQSLLTRERINIMFKPNDSHSTLKQHQCSQHHKSMQHAQCAPIKSSCSCQTQFVEQNQDTHQSVQTSETNQSIGSIEISCVTSQAVPEDQEQKDTSS